MEILIVIIGIILSIVSNAKKNEQRKAATERHRAATAARLQAGRQQAAPQKQSAAQAVTVPPVSYADVPGQVAMPTVHAHLQPDCEVHDAPGSLGAVTTEGKDPCHEEQLTIVRPPVEEEASPAGGLSFDWSGDSLVKAFVMQEVLNRPANRTAQRRAH